MNGTVMNGTVHVVVPGDIDDPAAPSGGNIYDRRVCRGLAAQGFPVHEHAMPGAWPQPGPSDRDNLAGVLARLPDGAATLVDGLVASAVPELLAPQADRLRLVILVHMPLGDDSPALRSVEGQAFSASAAVVTTSEWSRARLVQLYPRLAGRVHVAAPGADLASPTPPSPGGSRLLCVAALAPHKGHDVLVDALARIEDLSWSCVCAGSLDLDPDFAARIRVRAKESGLDDRLAFPGARAGRELDAAYATADLLVVPSRGETYGMVVTEALARGVPVVASAAKGLPEALGRAPDGRLPGILVPPGDAPALAGVLRRWLHEPALRSRLVRSALDRRETLAGWETTTRRVARVVTGVLGGSAWPAP